ncbi:hypothetical protein CAEBREN_29989 [Caenorhabditis brenneri]|uniref:Uncharacterized protein n=1 Tax=Caenorhabditis brenneri TaxID=135651 RepID=G0P112_CAEBE|nr:hypothetical protein CAEBREN_29989 [Caenorhabditis brenneri]
MGRVTILEEVSTTPASPVKSARKATLTTAESPSSSKGDFEIVEILEYVDDLYLQLLDPDRTIMMDDRNSTSNTENASSK